MALLSRRQLLTRCSGAGFTSLRRELGWLPPHLAGLPHSQEERLSRATAASLAASSPPDPQALS